MAKARSRTAARKLKDKWKSKSWYNVLAPASFDNVTIADTLTDTPNSLINRVTEVSLQDLTNDFRKSHLKLFFKINKVEETNAYTQFIGHTLTSDYLRRLIRRRRSKIDGVYDVPTRDGATLRVKPFATTDKRIQNSQRKVVRDIMKKTFTTQGKSNTLSELVKNIIDGKVGREIYKNCKQFYPVKRVEIYRTEVIQQPTIIIEEKKTKLKKEKKTKKKKVAEEVKEIKTKEEVKETELQEEKPLISEGKPTEETKEESKEGKPKKEGKKIKKEIKKTGKIPKKPALKKKTTKTKTATKKKATVKKKSTKKTKK